MEYLSDIQRLVLIILITVLFINTLRDIRKKKKATLSKGGSALLPVFIALVILVLDLNFYVVAYRLQVFFAGTFMLGLLLAYCSERYINDLKEDQLVTSGPYAIIRHPIWAGLVVAYISFLFLFFNPVTIALTAIYLAILTFTAVSEERFLHKTLPGYPDYARRTGRFLPKVRRRAS